mmetsp:Transcript_17825/g.19857  ORF Transcript_17825/g.19857 Transcript_17825/m.19857 type:complete len:103 (+) Transcript_17825:31-339(+)
MNFANFAQKMFAPQMSQMQNKVSQIKCVGKSNCGKVIVKLAKSSQFTTICDDIIVDPELAHEQPQEIGRLTKEALNKALEEEFHQVKNVMTSLRDAQPPANK